MINEYCLRSDRCTYSSCLNCEDFLENYTEELSNLVHTVWSKWMIHLFNCCNGINEDGIVIIPKECVERWKRQINTKYIDLSEEEKESDRREARRIMNAMDYYHYEEFKDDN